MNTKTLLLVILLAAMALSSCAPSPALVATPTELPPTVTPVPSTATPTPTNPPPAILISEPVECTTGPGQGYSVVATLEPGTPIELAGQDATRGYWIVLEPKARRGCWIERTRVSLQGDGSSLPELIPGPTQQTTPDAPTDFRAKTSCVKKTRGTSPTKWKTEFYEVTISLSWEDQSENETGFELQRNREPYRLLAENVTTLTDALTLDHPISSSVLYWLQAINQNGKSARVEVIATYRC